MLQSTSPVHAKSFRKSQPFYSRKSFSHIPLGSVSYDKFLELIQHSKGIGFRPFAVLTSNPLSDKWLYIDHDNNVQGGFTCEEMDTWYNMDYFDHSLKIAFKEPGAYKPLSEYLDLAAQSAFNLYFYNKPISVPNF